MCFFPKKSVKDEEKDKEGEEEENRIDMRRLDWV